MMMLGFWGCFRKVGWILGLCFESMDCFGVFGLFRGVEFFR